MVDTLRRITSWVSGGDTMAWGIFDAIRAVHIEDHVVDVIAFLVKDAG
jgi:hypothetical protein